IMWRGVRKGEKAGAIGAICFSCYMHTVFFSRISDADSIAWGTVIAIIYALFFAVIPAIILGAIGGAILNLWLYRHLWFYHDWNHDSLEGKRGFLVGALISGICTLLVVFAQPAFGFGYDLHPNQSTTFLNLAIALGIGLLGGLWATWRLLGDVSETIADYFKWQPLSLS
ncbi:MAG: hypothetical protein WA821_19380, partial [Anaerolineales bacterium]